MSKYTDASKFYDAMILNWKRYKEGKEPGMSYAKAISNALAMASLDLPNPFEGHVETEEATPAEEAAKEEPVKEEEVVEPEPEKEEIVAEVKQNKRRFFGKER